MTINILLIDDDEASRASLQGYFQNKPEIRIEAYAKGNQALVSLRTNPEFYQIVMLDWVLDADMSGGQVLEGINNLNPYLPVIVLTAKASDAGVEIIRKGAYWYLYKPFEMSELEELIQELSAQDTALRLIAENAQTLLGTDQCLVWRYERRKQAFSLAAYVDPDPMNDSDRSAWLERGDPKLEEVLRKEAPVFTKNLSPADTYHPQEFVTGRENWRARICMPLRHKGELLGLLEGYYQEVWQYPEDRRKNVAAMLGMFVNLAAEAMYNAAQNRKNRVLINNLSTLLKGQHSLSAIAEAILKKAIDVTDAATGWLYINLFPEAGSELELIACLGCNAALTPRLIQDNDSIIGFAAQEGTAQVNQDTEDFSKINPLPLEDIRTQMAMPLRRAGLTTAVLVLGSPYPNAFSDGDISLIHSFAELAGPALDQARMREYLQKIGQAALGNQREMEATVVDAVYHLTGKPVALWMLLDDNYSMDLRAARGISEATRAEGKIFYSGESKTLIGRALATKEIASQVEGLDTSVVQNTEFREMADRESWKSNLAVPLFSSEDKPMAFITLHNKEAVQFVGYEIDLVRSLARQAAAHIENFRRRQNLERLLDSSQITLRHLNDEKEALAKFAEMACELTGAPCAVIYPYDPGQKTFYDVDRVAVFGLKKDQKNVSHKPRLRELATIIRYIGKLVVNNWDKLAIDLEPVDLSRVPLKPSMDQDDLFEMVRGSKFMRREEIRAFVGISLRASGAIRGQEEEVGVLYINYRTSHKFTPSEIQLIQLFAQQVASQIHSVRLWQRQQTLTAASRALAQATTGENVLRGVFHQAFHFVGSTTGMVLWVQKNHHLRIVDHQGLSQQQINAFHERPVYDNEGSFGEVIRTGEKFESLDTRADLKKGRLADFGLPIPMPKKRGVKGKLTNLPIKASGRVEAILVLDTVIDNPGVEEALQALTDMASTALEKTLADQERAEQLETLKRIVDAIGTTDPLPIIMEQTARLSGSDYGSLNLCIPSAKDEELEFAVLWEKDRLVLKNEIPVEKLCRSWNTGITGSVARSGKLRREDDLINTRPKDYLCWYADTQSELALPMIGSEGQVIGVLNLESRYRAAYTSEMEDFYQRLANVAAQVVEKSSLFESTRKLNRQLELLYQVVGEQDLDNVLQQILEGLNELMGDDTSSSINLYKEDTDQFFSIMALGPNAVSLKEPARPKGQGGTARYVLQDPKKKPLFLDDVRHPLPGIPTIRPEGIELGVKSFAALPLLRDKRVLGALFIHKMKSVSFTRDVQRLLETFARQAAIAIDNAQRLFDVTAFREINDSISSKNLQYVLDLIVRKAVQSMRADFGGLWLVEESGDLKLAASQMLESISLEPVSMDIKSSHGGTNRLAVETRQPVIIDDVSKVDHFYKIYANAQSSITMPILYHTEVIGTLNLESSQLNAYSPQDTLTLDVFADQAAIALETARLVANLNTKVSALAAVNKIGQQLNTSIHLVEREILSIIHDRASEVMDTENMFIALYDPSKDEVWFELAYVDGQAVDIANRPDWGPRQHGTGRTEEVIHAKKPRLSRTIAESEAWYDLPERKNYIHTNFASWVGAPMLSGDQVLGVIATYHKTEEYKYDEDDVNVLTLMASQAASALLNARLVQNIERRNEELTQLADLGVKLGGITAVGMNDL